MLPFLLALIAVPALEIYVIITVAHLIGGWLTVGLLLAVSASGYWLIKREGRRTFRALREAVEGGRAPDREVVDASLVFVGGALVVVPGFVTDVVGLLLAAPFTRPLTRRLLTWAMARHAARRMAMMQRHGGPPGPGGPESGPTGPVIQGEIIQKSDQRTDHPSS
ncbi:FxsA family protein [Actinopolymorpha pittospori]